MVAVLRKIVKVSERILLSLGSLCLFVIIAAITAGIVSRKVFNTPYSWTEELCTFLFVGLAFFGAAVAASRGRHISVDFVTGKIPEKFNKPIDIVIHVLILILLVLIIVGGLILQPNLMRFYSVALRIPKNLYYVPITIGSAHMFLHYLADLIELTIPQKKEA